MHGLRRRKDAEKAVSVPRARSRVLREYSGSADSKSLDTCLAMADDRQSATRGKRTDEGLIAEG